MSNGISAIKGFDYQATVTLDLLFDHFDGKGQSARVRPEGHEDIDLTWQEGSVERRHYFQIKKPREDNQGNLKPSPWTLVEAVDELLPNTIKNLCGNLYEQTWILGDLVSDALQSLLNWGADAPLRAADVYWTALHLLVRDEVIKKSDLDKSTRNQLLRWRPTVDQKAAPADALQSLVQAFLDEITASGAPSTIADRYRDRVIELHQCLPDILSRTRVLAAYGTEQGVAAHVYARLEQRYSLQRSVVENTLFRNLHGFITDISKQPGRRFDNAEFEFELRAVWPQMIPIRDAPSLDPSHIRRPDLTERFTTRWTGSAVEAVGISGSGKTMLAAEIAERSLDVDPGRLVYYAEVRPDTELRDVLVGLSFHLHRWGLTAPFAKSVEIGPPDEEVIELLGRLYSSLGQPILLLVDLVEGASSGRFARDIAAFIRSCTPLSSFRLAVLGQESAFRALTRLERDQYAAGRVDVRGFRFEEFFSLVAQNHTNPDRASLSAIYDRITGGREAGLFAALGQLIASAPSIAAMDAIAQRPAEDMVSFAERQRFDRLGTSAKSAAERLICFALPFRRRDAEEAFPNENVGTALYEMLTLGLLRSHDVDSFEMHEIIRAGLEQGIAPSVRRQANEALAAMYAKRDLPTAEILHLEKAGNNVEAHRRARETFLLGKHWAALSSYVMQHKLVSIDELIDRMASAAPIDDSYVFPTILRELGSDDVVEKLISVLRAQPDPFLSDYQRGLSIAEAILERKPAALNQLISWMVGTIAEPVRRESALGWLSIAAQRKRVQADCTTVAIFNNASLEVKGQILPFLLQRRHRDTLRAAFSFLARDPELHTAATGARQLYFPSLQISSREDAVEFLASLPDVDPNGMIASRSPLLGRLGNIVWSRRKELRAYGLQILNDGTEDEKIIEGAIRVLVFLGESDVWELTEPLTKRQDRIGRVAALVPAMLPGVCDQSRYEARVLDAGLPLESRTAALNVLALAGVDLGPLFQRVVEQERSGGAANALRVIFLLSCAHSPFIDAVALVDDAIKSNNPNAVPIITAALAKLAELPDPKVTDLLIKALPSPIPEIRQAAAAMLASRRSRRALPYLRAQFEGEENESLRVMVAGAIVASGPSGLFDMRSSRPDTPGTRLWRCILATRLRDATAADEIVSIAVDTAQNWQLRRAAIFAAGRMPYDAALAKIIPVIMREQTSLTLDKSEVLECHATLSWTLLCDVQGLLRIFRRGRSEFIAFFADIFEVCWQQLPKEGLPAGSELAGWLFDRLRHYGWPSKTDAPDRLLNELHIPILQAAVLRSLRIAGRPEQIEALLPDAPSVWFTIKCITERRRTRAYDPDLRSRLQGLVAASAFSNVSIVERILLEIPVGDPPPVVAPQPAAAPGIEARSLPIIHLGYDDAVRILTGTGTSLDPDHPVMLGPLTLEQFERLVKLADPSNDRHPSVETFVPGVSFSAGGHTVARRRVTSHGGEAPAALIRPAIAAANRFHVSIPWHEESLSSVFSQTYIPRFLASLDAQNDSERFHEELNAHADLLLPYLCRAAVPTSAVRYVDARAVPLLLRHTSTGSDEFFETLCTLVLQLNTPEVDPVLSGLLFRFVQSFDIQSMNVQHTLNQGLWRGFNQLARHPRFEMIAGWQSRLAPLLGARLDWFHRENILRVLEKSPRSYLIIESQLFRATNWRHYQQDEIDRLDAAAERLFPSLLELSANDALTGSRRPRWLCSLVRLICSSFRRGAAR
ncbi:MULTISPECIES: HEAT repeat domain-containing protein [unclassified Bradyrhizobium]|uniref:HEAT repeat domain-containing protein n=1 Tax=unclassified Bradyrhizobium TaxID=2631580 RepID=UPI0029168654|nr:MULTISPECIES: HEAT repeat domain-containing protein [unclassified Bradyrhizobium]